MLTIHRYWVRREVFEDEAAFGAWCDSKSVSAWTVFEDTPEAVKVEWMTVDG